MDFFFTQLNESTCPYMLERNSLYEKVEETYFMLSVKPNAVLKVLEQY